MITIVEDQNCFTILYPKRTKQLSTSTRTLECDNTETIEHTTRSCKNHLAASEGAINISTFHRDITVTLRKTENAYRTELFKLLQTQKDEYVKTVTVSNIQDKVKKFSQIKEQITNIRTAIDRTRLSRAMNRKIKEALTSILTKLQVTDKICSYEFQLQVNNKNSIMQYLIPINPAEMGYSGKGD